MEKIKLNRELTLWLNELVTAIEDADTKLDNIQIGFIISDLVDNSLQDGDEKFVDLKRCRSIDTHRASQYLDWDFPEVPERIEFWRKKRGLSVSDLCKLARISKDEYEDFINLRNDLLIDGLATGLPPLLFVGYDQTEGLHDIQGISFVLSNIRMNLGITRQEIADAAGVDVDYVRRVEMEEIDLDDPKEKAKYWKFAKDAAKPFLEIGEPIEFKQPDRDGWGATSFEIDLKDDVYLQALIVAKEGKEGLAKRLKEAEEQRLEFAQMP